MAKAAPAPAPGPAPKTNLTFQYIHDDIPSGPWSIHVFKVARAHSGWDIDTTLGGGNRFGLSVVSEQVKSIPPSDGKPVAAINGDFFESARVYLGDPEGLQIIRGELISGPNPTRACFYMDANGGCHRTNVTPQFTVKWPNGSTTPFGLNEFRDASTAVLYTEVVGPATRTSGGREIILERMGTNDWLPLRPGVHYTAKVREVRDTGNTPLKPDIAVISLPPALISRVPAVKPGDTVMVSTDSSPSLAGARTALGGGPSLVQNGKARDWGFFQMRHPRAVIGWSKDFFYLVVVDGRQRESVGMTYTEVGNYLVKIGCEEAINLDGGGSTTLWAFGQVMNSPSLGRERPSANALVILQTKKPEAGTNAPPAK